MKNFLCMGKVIIKNAINQQINQRSEEKKCEYNNNFEMKM